MRWIPCVGLIVAIACEEGESVRAADADETALTDTTCMFDTTIVRPWADSLVREFVRRAAAGEFGHAEPWLQTAVDCVGHEPGYDHSFVLDSAALVGQYGTGDTLSYVLRSTQVGLFEGGAYRAQPATARRDTITLYRTRFGWRIRSPAFWNWESVERARGRGIVAPPR